MGKSFCLSSSTTVQLSFPLLTVKQRKTSTRPPNLTDYWIMGYFRGGTVQWTHTHTLMQAHVVCHYITFAKAVSEFRSWNVNITTAECKPTGQRRRCWRDVLFHAKVFQRVNKLAFTKGDAGAPLPGKGLLSIHLRKRKANVVVGETG